MEYEMKKFKIILLALLTVCVALCVCFAAACKNGDNDNDNSSGTEQPGGDNPNTGDNPDPKPEEGTKDNPVIISKTGSTRVTVPEGATLYFKVTAPAPAEGKAFTVSSGQTKAAFTSGTRTGNPVELIADEKGNYLFTLAISDGTRVVVSFTLTVEESSDKGGSESNPIDISDAGEFNASVAAGATVYYRLSVKDSVAESEEIFYSVYAENDKAVFKCGETTGADIRLTLSTDGRYSFSVSMSDGAAADFKFTVKLNAPQGSEHNPYVAEVYDGTPETQYNSFHFTAKGGTVHNSFVADATGFYVISSDCEYVTLTGGYGFVLEEDAEGKTGAFKLVAYVKEGQSFSFGAMLGEKFGGDVAEVKFSIVCDKENGAGTESDPYALQIGDICLFMIDAQDDPVYVKVTDGSGNAVAARLFAPNSSADFGGRGSKYDFKADGSAVDVWYGHGYPAFIVNQPE